MQLCWHVKSHQCSTFTLPEILSNRFRILTKSDTFKCFFLHFIFIYLCMREKANVCTYVTAHIWRSGDNFGLSVLLTLRDPVWVYLWGLVVSTLTHGAISLVQSGTVSSRKWPEERSNESWLRSGFYLNYQGSLCFQRFCAVQRLLISIRNWK